MREFLRRAARWECWYLEGNSPAVGRTQSRWLLRAGDSGISSGCASGHQDMLVWSKNQRLGRKSVGLGSVPNRMCTVGSSCPGSGFISWDEGEAVASVLSLSQDPDRGSPAIPIATSCSGEPSRGGAPSGGRGPAQDPLELTAWRLPLDGPLCGEPYNVARLSPSGNGPGGGRASPRKARGLPSSEPAPVASGGLPAFPGQQARHTGRGQGSRTRER